MGILVSKQKEGYNLTKIAKISLVGLIVSLAAACVDTIWALYMNSFINNIAYVGFVSSFLTMQEQLLQQFSFSYLITFFSRLYKWFH